MIPPTEPVPVRIYLIDAIRGMAVLGILLANIQSWSGYKFISFGEIEVLPLYHLDGLFYQLHLWLVDGKFYAIFSMLFGAGFGIQYLKNRGDQPPFLHKYRRRLGFLLLFGVLHALVWSGDILTLYALLAFVLVLLRNLALERLLPLAIFLMCFFALPQMLMLAGVAEVSTGVKLAHKSFADMAPGEVTASFAEGSWIDVFTSNLHHLYWRWMDFLPNGRISRVLGFFVLGFYLAQSAYFTSTVYKGSRLLQYLLLGIAATAVARFTGTNITQWAVSGGDVLLKMVLVAGQLFLALAYMSLLAQVSRTVVGDKLLAPLTLVGRMAFTSYLLQTVIGISLFYGVGFGLWGTMGLAQLWLLALLIFACQVLFCSIWLRYFRQGPVEWLWGCLTAGRLQSNWRSVQ